MQTSQSNIEILNQLDKTVGLKNLAAKGLISVTVLALRDIYLEYDVFVKMGYTTTIAVDALCEKFKVSEFTVYRAKREMER